MTIMDKLAGITEQVRNALQAIIEKCEFIGVLVATSHQPSWYVSPEQQLACASKLWPNINLPEEPPSDFVPRTKTEGLLLQKVVKADKRNLRL